MVIAISKDIRAEAEMRLMKGETVPEVARALGLKQGSVSRWVYALVGRTTISTDTQQKITTALARGQQSGEIAIELQIPKKIVDDLEKTSQGKPLRVLHPEEAKQKALSMIASGTPCVRLVVASFFQGG